MKPEISIFRIDEHASPVAASSSSRWRARRGSTLAFVPCSLTVRSDRRLLRRLLQNLVSNAIKYTPQGRVLVGCRRRGGKLASRCWDTGLGIPASKQTRRVQRVPAPRPGRTAARGLGLGLSIVERIARVLDHPIRLRSDVGPRLGLRRRSADRGAAAGHGAPARAPRRRRQRRWPACVLCIDNEPDHPGRHATLLSGWGCAVLTAAACRGAGRAEARKLVPDVIVADYHLDEGDGLEAIAALRWQIGARAAGRPAHRRPLPGRRGTKRRKSDVHVLNKPLKPAALRALLAQWRSSRVAAE